MVLPKAGWPDACWPYEPRGRVGSFEVTIRHCAQCLRVFAFDGKQFISHNPDCCERYPNNRSNRPVRTKRLSSHANLTLLFILIQFVSLLARQEPLAWKFWCLPPLRQAPITSTFELITPLLPLEMPDTNGRAPKDLIFWWKASIRNLLCPTVALPRVRTLDQSPERGVLVWDALYTRTQ